MNLDDRLRAARDEHRARAWPEPPELSTEGAGQAPAAVRTTRWRVVTGTAAVAACLLAGLVVVRTGQDDRAGDRVVAGSRVEGPLPDDTTPDTAALPPPPLTGDLATGLVLPGPEPDAPAQPEGWRTLGYADFRFAVPPDWVVPTSDTCLAAAGGGDSANVGGVVLIRSVVTGDPRCQPALRLPDSRLVFEPGQDPVAGDPVPVGALRAVPVASPGNGIHVLQFDEGTRVTATGPDADRVLATFAASDRLRALHDGPVRDTAGWQTITFGGVAVSVPGDWPVVDLPASVEVTRDAEGNVTGGGGRLDPGSCGTELFPTTFDTGPTAFTGTSGIMAGCAAPTHHDLASGDGVWLRTLTEPEASSSPPPAQTITVGTTTIVLREATRDPAAPVLDIDVVQPTGTVRVSIGVTAEPSTARTILRSLRLA